MADHSASVVERRGLGWIRTGLRDPGADFSRDHADELNRGGEPLSADIGLVVLDQGHPGLREPCAGSGATRSPAQPPTTGTTCRSPDVPFTDEEREVLNLVMALAPPCN